METIDFLSFEVSPAYLEWVREAISQDASGTVQESMTDANAVDILTVLYELNTEESKYILKLLDKEKAADVIVEIEEEDQTAFLRNFAPAELANFIDYLDSDDGADILNRLPIQTREEVIDRMQNAERARHVKDLIRYEEDRAGGLMAKELIKVDINWTILQCIEEIRRQAEKVDKLYSVYVVNDKNQLLGKVSLKRIILSQDQTRIADIYDSEIISVPTFMEEEEIAEIMQKYDLEVIPVVDVLERLVGRITIDDIVDVITEMAEEERQLMAGISGDVEERSDSVWQLSRARLPWLIIGMLGGLLGARFIGIFEADIALVPAMAFFIPLITATGGNVGIQSSSLVVQSLATSSVFGDQLAKRLVKVLIVALINGLSLGALVLGFNLLFGEELRLAGVVAIALFSVVLLASFMGTLTPLVLNRFGVNPALASGPFITTANDLLGLAVYFSVAHLLYEF
ncbi:magnesium transporter [Tunicatimonas pelagia]|uniref:magnesium transporter n=1 Tax=Tunicatimonas pelagia TaxID=931531 RepID=UPI002666CD69|nr:magnesium transporter [Tunicatimonas pelagia]WKN44471.1 magnesium transporter [Tunicatimonas pelagia]